MRFRYIWKLYDNRLKRVENVLEKNRLEAEYYNKHAERCLANLDEYELIESESEELPPRYRYFYARMGDLRGKRILNLCCGDARGTAVFATQGAMVYSIDIAEKMLQLDRIRAKTNEVSAGFRFIQMAAEQMGFKGAQFDVVFSLGALHHLQPHLAGIEIARVLKPGGRAVFLEPLAYHKALFFVRSLTPAECYESPGGGGMSYSDIQCIARSFSNVTWQEFLLFQRLVRIKSFRRFKRRLARLDTKVLSVFPFMRNFAAGIVIEFQK